MDAVLGRKVLDYVTAHRDEFDMKVFGIRGTACGTVACLAGHAMLLSGYSLAEAGGGYPFSRPDGTPVFDEASEATRLLALTDEEYYGDWQEPATLFGPQNDDYAIGRLRSLVEAAEAARGGGPARG